MTRRRRQGKRRIAVITGTRAEYGLLTSTLAAITNDPRLDLQLVVTGMHLLRRFGCTIRDIERDGWPIAARVRMQTGKDGALDQAEGLARGVAGIARYLDSAATDIVLVLGDRIEALAGALAAVTTGRILAHIHGGDVAPGDFDDSLRHAVTKLAHIHFPATQDAARRIIHMGEHPRHVHVVGAPGLDRLRELLDQASAPHSPERTALIVYHAHGRAAAVEKRIMTAILDAAAKSHLRRVVLYPNTDRGHTGVIDAISQHQRRHSAADVQALKSLPRDDYLRALIRAAVLIGNSSSGIIEAPLAGTPSVNVGERQAGREVAGRSVLHCAETPAAVRSTLRLALRKRPRPARTTPYGDGHAGQNIAEILATLPLDDQLRRKTIVY